MVIKEIKLSNFNQFEALSLELSTNFTLLVGENSSGKTTILDALSMIASVWVSGTPVGRQATHGMVFIPGDKNKRLIANKVGDRFQFEQSEVSKIDVIADIGGKEYQWENSSTGAKQNDATVAINKMSTEEKRSLSIFAYYTAHRSFEMAIRPTEKKPARWDAFNNCIVKGLNYVTYKDWFKKEAIAFASNGAKWRPGYLAVRNAIFRCVPDSTDVYFDPDLDDIVIVIADKALPLYTLSAGQKMMLGMVIDIATRAVALNAHLLDNGPEFLLEHCPGLILIDELDLHLHPRWQRHVANDLQKAFPGMQFIATSHSPQIIGEVPSEDIRLLRADGRIEIPTVARGVDSNWILDHVMQGASSRSDGVKQLIKKAEDALDDEDLKSAKNALRKAEEIIDGSDGKITSLWSRLESLEMLLR